MRISTKILLISILASLSLTESFGQTATIQVVRQFYDNSFQNFDSIKFHFDSINFSSTDTTVKTLPLDNNLTHGIAILGEDSINFLIKFRPNVEYHILPGCCCATFTIEPKTNPRLGTLTFKNDTDKELILSVCDNSYDTVKVNKEIIVNASESAMCMFRSCRIVVSDNTLIKKKVEENVNNILTERYFHYLHGEKIQIIYNKKRKEYQIRLKGYLSDKEYEDKWK